MVHQLSKEEKIVVSLASSEPLVDALIRALKYFFLFGFFCLF